MSRKRIYSDELYDNDMSFPERKAAEIAEIRARQHNRMAISKFTPKQLQEWEESKRNVPEFYDHSGMRRKSVRHIKQIKSPK